MTREEYADVRRGAAWPLLSGRERASLDAERRRERLDAAGACYCDAHYLCLTHAREFHAEQGRLAALPARGEA